MKKRKNNKGKSQAQSSLLIAQKWKLDLAKMVMPLLQFLTRNSLLYFNILIKPLVTCFLFCLLMLIEISIPTNQYCGMTKRNTLILFPCFSRYLIPLLSFF